jgi:lysophospholipase L1-like esterase
VYNWKAANTRKLRSSLGKAQAGTARAHHFFVGDSETDKYVGNGVDYAGMWYRIFKAELVALGIPSGGEGLIRAGQTGTGGALGYDPRWTFAGTWATQGTGTYNQATANASTGTLVTSEPCTTIVIAAYGSSGTFSLTVDGGTPAGGNVAVTNGTYSAGTVTPSGGATVETLVVITGLSNAVHTVVYTSLGASNRHLIAANCLLSTGLVVHNFGRYGITAQLYASNIGGAVTTQPAAWETIVNSPSAVTPDAVWIALGVNDITAGGRTNDQIATDITTIRNHWPNSDAVIVAQYQPSAASDATWQAYVARLYDLADTLDVPLLDLYDSSGGYTIANANGMMGDTVHPSAPAQRSWGRRAALISAA